MWQKGLIRHGKQYIINTEGAVCSMPQSLLNSDIFGTFIEDYLESLKKSDIGMYRVLFGRARVADVRTRLRKLLLMLTSHSLDSLVDVLPEARSFLDKRAELADFIELCYNFWREKERFLLCLSEQGPWSYDQRPFRTFNSTVEQLTDVLRATYRDIMENITNDHPRVYRQVQAGCQAGVIAVPKPWKVPGGPYRQLARIPFVRQVWIDPPMIIDPPTNTRTGRFSRVEKNPLNGMKLDPEQWLCYPIQVGPLTVFVYFHLSFIGLGLSLSNLFEMSKDDEIAGGPDAICFFGADPALMAQFGDLPTVFYEDAGNGLLVGAVPCEDRFGYFGYLKKMVLTLHNIVMMKRGRMPYHGAMCRILLKGGKYLNVLLIGDTATGKSETLEALRTIGAGRIQSLQIIADDMGSMEIDRNDRCIRGYGTEIGAFIRLDDLQAGYAFGEIDRAIIMSPHKTNARVVLPVTTLRRVLAGHRVDLLLYANNYEEVGPDKPILQRFSSKREALATFREGVAMAKGTTTATGLVKNYFANIFGPPQYQELHDRLAEKVFEAAFRYGIWVGQMRSRLALPGYSIRGPEAAARELLKLVGQSTKVVDRR